VLRQMTRSDIIHVSWAILLYVTAGACITVICAWCLSATSNVRSRPDISAWMYSGGVSRFGEEVIIVRSRRAFGAMAIDTIVGNPYDWSDYSFDPLAVKRLVPSWAKWWLLADLREGEDVEHRSVEAWGWPVPALWCAPAEDVEGRLKAAMGGIALRDRARESAHHGYIATVPLRPITRGFILDVLFWTGLLFVGRSALLRLRRGIRVRQGRCASCGHLMMRSSRCPECGYCRD
jgi:hypothetical protein